jgi:hypothetical protein
MIENELLTIVQAKGSKSLEDVIIEHSKTKTQFTLHEVCHITFQLAKYLTLFEFKRDCHLNITAHNLIGTTS